MPSEHALLAPSAAHRWMHCPASARLEACFPSRDTVYTLEGTFAHACAERALNNLLDAEAKHTDPKPDAFADLYEQLETEGFSTADAISYALDHFVQPVWAAYQTAKASDPEAVLLVEQKLDLSAFVPGGFGSSDAVLISRGRLTVYDLKYGKGVKVYAEQDGQLNEQMLCYALGAVIGAGELYHIDTVRMTIIQPRLSHTSTAEISYDRLLEWAARELRPAAVAATVGTEMHPGSHCRFCRAAARCQALHDYAEGAAGALRPAPMTVPQLAEALGSLDIIKAWIKSVEDASLRILLEGGSLPGWKLVEGRSNRRISDPDGAVKALRDAGLDDASIFKPQELRTISELEALLTKPVFKTLLGEFVTRPKGSPTIAPETDSRADYRLDAATEFAGQIINP